MSVGQIYKDYLLENIIKESLLSGVVPEKNATMQQLESLIGSNKSIAQPFLSVINYTLEDAEVSSASKTTKALETLNSDLIVLYRALIDQAGTITNTHESLLSELSFIEKKVMGLEDRIRNLLLISKNADGYFDYTADSFVDKAKVDTVRSDILVDNKAGYVALEPLSQSRIPLTLTSKDVQFNVISRDGLRSITSAPGSNIINIFSDQNNFWQEKVTMNRGHSSVTTELTIRLPIATKEISKIVLQPLSSNDGGVFTVSLFYSSDGINWITPDEHVPARIVSDTTLLFNSFKASYLKFIFTKTGYDAYINESYIYEFGLKSVKLYGLQYLLTQNKLTGTFYSKALRGQKESNFNKISLKVCETLPAQTNILFSIAALTESEYQNYLAGTLDVEGLNFLSIDPIDRKEKNNESLINYAQISQESGFSSIYQVDTGLTFPYSTSYNQLLNYVVSPGILKDDIKVLRNIGNNEIDNGGGKPIQVLDTDCGWKFDGTNYSCEFYIAENAGRTINLGQKEAVVDGVRINGKVFLAQGYHRFITNKDNWRTVDPSLITSPSSVNPDILYPFNHKYLIEGIRNTLYGVSLTQDLGGKTRKEILDPDGLYSFNSLFWGQSLKYSSDFNFINNVGQDNLSFYAFVKDDNGIERIAVKYINKPGLLEEEKLAIITRTVSGTMYNAVILKAILLSADSRVSPILDEYMIRLGY